MLIIITLLGGLALTAVLYVLTGRLGEQSIVPGTTIESAGPTTSNTTTPSTAAKTPAPNASDTIAINASSGERVEVKVEIADDPAKRQKGLMERTALAENAGMLFVFNREQQLSFFMKNTLIPLSIAYIDGGGRIVDIQDMQPLDETPHPSAAPARYALEVNQGFFREHDVEVGDTVELPRQATSAVTPSAAEVIQAFDEAGLEVGNVFPVEQEPGWDQKPVPKTYEEAARFEIPSLGEGYGGRVYVFGSEENLNAVYDYYEGLPSDIRPYIYVKDKVLVQITNQLP
ncbi:MAG: DUF192 domain-containing protein, partial [Rubrobacter sp.]|nr:DUF192 domain-containing protein [Rubrobacter sp.]